MKRLAALLLCGLLLGGCALFAPPRQPAPPARAWSLSAGDTRLARLEAGRLAVVWCYSLDMAFYRRGGESAEGVYEGRLMLRVETECYVDGVYRPLPESLEGSGLGGEAWLLSEMISLDLVPAGDPLKRVAEAMAWDDGARAALGLAAQPDSDWLRAAEGREAAQMAVFDCDDYGEKLKPAESFAPDWQSAFAQVLWEDASPAWTWQRLGEVARLAAEAGEFEGQAVAETGYAPAWERVFSGWGAGLAGQPMWVNVAANGAAEVYLPGLAPLEAGRPFAARMHSGGSVAANLPAPPESLAAESLPPEPDESASERPIWPPPASGSGEDGESGDAGGSAESSASVKDSGGADTEKAPDPLAEAMAVYDLPYPPRAAITGPVKGSGVLRFDIEGFDYEAAVGYARKLKMGGYSRVLGEVEQPILDLYSFSARNAVGLQVSLTYDNGRAYLLAM